MPFVHSTDRGGGLPHAQTIAVKPIALSSAPSEPHMLSDELAARPIKHRASGWHQAPTGIAVVPWSIANLLRNLGARESHPALIQLHENRSETWDSVTLADRAWRLAYGLREAGIDRGKAVGLWAPNSPIWIVSAMAVLAAGGVLVPIDDLAEPAEFEAALKSAGCALVITTRHHLEAASAILREQGIGAVVVDQDEHTAADIKPWRSLLGEPEGDLPEIEDDDPAMLCWTSGTTGSPKAFVLSHRNIATNVEALQRSAIVGPADRALLPLPMHHVYPFVVGTLTPLTCGTAIVLPAGTSGPLLMRALREGGVTVLIGVPRLYEAFIAAIGIRIAASGKTARMLWRALLRCVIFLQRSTGLQLGRLFFAPVRHGVAPKLHLLVSGGASLAPGAEQELEALGWMVLSGYGLAETASLFTGNQPDARRIGSAGRPLADGKIRIAKPDAGGVGEIELRGGSITKGYLHDPEANTAAFTSDGWFRTGDLGFVDRDGFLFVTGRVKETLVLGGGKKISPEALERIYGDAPEIAEIAVLEYNGALVALVRPDPAKLYDRGATNLRDGIRVILGEKAQRLPSFHRLSGFALTGQPLPRTRLGKYRRFLLPALYAQALAGASTRVAYRPTPEDETLLRHPAAAAAWHILRQRFSQQPLDLDTSLSLDLNLDSFAWMELAIMLDERAGIALSDQDLARIQTIRDLLRLAVQRRIGAGTAPARGLGTEDWLVPTGAFLAGLGFVLYAINRLIMRALFHLRVEGLERLPAAGAFVIAPNHVSYLDVLVVAAALSWSRLRHTYWAGDAKRFFPHRLGRTFCRAVHLFPVDAMHPGAALETAYRVLETGNILVWFPEGWRSPDGRLQHFLPGIGQLLVRSGAPALPAHIAGTFEALPRGQIIPRFRRLTITFGHAALPISLCAAGSGATDEERVADGLHHRLAALAQPSTGGPRDEPGATA